MSTKLFSVLLAICCVPAFGAGPVRAMARPDGTVVIETAVARFTVSPSGYLSGDLLKDGRALTLDAPAAGAASDSVVIDGHPLVRFHPLSAPEITDASGGFLGPGKRVEIVSRAGPSVEQTRIIEVFNAFPGLVLTTTTYKNIGAKPFHLDEAITQRHRLSTAMLHPNLPPYQFWSFQGSSTKWGLDDMVPLSAGFSRQNPVGVSQTDGNGGGVPVLAFWEREVGLAIGHLDTRPLTLQMPVQVEADGFPVAELRFSPKLTLNPGESYSTPAVFEMVYSGDYYEPLRTYTLILQRKGWPVPKPSDAAYQISWCGWGYESNVTLRDMTRIIPKLKEFHIKWATLDDRWFDAYGDWNPRPDTFPGDSIKKLTAEYHRNGIHAQLWWLPLAAEMKGPKYEDHTYIDSQVVREHPDWLILDKNGKPALMTRHLATLCPALPAVQQYYKQLTIKFIRDWGFDGHKLDNIFSVPACYNPKHHHKLPYDSVTAMGEVYKIIYDTTRELKPDSVTQACPCGTPPNIAWLPYMDQPVTADPVGSIQVRRRIKMYKALLGPEAPVYGDHVELTELVDRNGREVDFGKDFASTVGTGGVPGTKFVWPQTTDPKYRDVALTPDKDQLWKKWIGIYQRNMLSRGEFLDLYTIGYDTPEGYAIAKNGKMYYAFFAGKPHDSYHGPIELRGLSAGRYRVFDYVNNRELGNVTAPDPRLDVSFTGSLLLEVTK
ncbi:MAG TPA: alpha-galactosidase [Bryobacteraceae bacterium]|nr:alpha-galactosidase [Bryobacteraceae bacterium]